MPIEKLDPYDPALVEEVLAMHKSSVSLIVKIRVIWDLASRMIELIEKKYPNPIKKIWGAHANQALSTSSLFARTHTATQYSLNNIRQESYLATAYFGALGDMKLIQKNIEFITPPAPAPAPDNSSLIRGNNYQAFLDIVFASKQLESQQFLNYVVPHFFSLQLHCYNLLIIVKTPKGVPIEPSARKKRAYAAVNSKNYGEEILKSSISIFLNSINPKTKFKNISRLVRILEKDLGNVLQEYKDQLGSPTIKNGPTLNYGDDLDTWSLVAKLHDWKKNDPEFRSCLDRICIILDKGKATP